MWNEGNGGVPPHVVLVAFKPKALLRRIDVHGGAGETNGLSQGPTSPSKIC